MTMTRLIRTRQQRRVAAYMLREGGDLGTTNPHYTATEACVTDNVVHAYFRKLRRNLVLVTHEHSAGGRMADIDTRAILLTPGPGFGSFIHEAKRLGLEVCDGLEQETIGPDGLRPDPGGIGYMVPYKGGAR